MIRTVPLVLLLTAAPAALAAQSWESPYAAAGTLGRLLEHSFEGVLKDCGLTQGLVHERRLAPDRRLSAVPRALQTNLPLGERILEQGNNSLARVLLYLYPDRQSAERLQLTNSDRLLAGYDPGQEPLSMLDPGTSRLAHAHSCRSVVAAALDARAGVSVPAAHVRVALQSEFDQTRSVVLVLTEGQFRSPIAVALQGSSHPEGIATRMLLWDWYVRHGVPTPLPYYIADLRGGTLYRTFTAARSHGSTFDLAAGAGIPGIGNIEGSLRATLNVASGTEVDRVGTFHYLGSDGKPRLRPVQVPGPGTLAAELGAMVVPALQREPLAPLTDLAPHVHYHEIAGVPQQLCNRASWEVVPAQGQRGTLELEAVAAEPNRDGVCRYTVSYRLAPVPNADVVRLAYTLVTRGRLGGHRLEIPVRRVELNTVAGPVARPEVFDPRWKVEGTDLVWRIPIRILDHTNTINFGEDPTVSDDALVCGNASVAMNPPVARMGAGTATLTLVRPMVGPALDTAGPGQNCRWTGALVLHTLQGGRLRRSLESLEITFPYPTAPAAIAAGNGN